MDAGEMRELMRAYLAEMDWPGEVDGDAIVAHLSGRDQALWALANEYLPGGSYPDVEHALTVIPQQAWQDAQGDAWRGADIELAGDTPSGFADGPVGQDDGTVHRAGDPPPPTPGFGDATGSSA